MPGGSIYISDIVQLIHQQVYLIFRPPLTPTFTYMYAPTEILPELKGGEAKLKIFSPLKLQMTCPDPENEVTIRFLAENIDPFANFEYKTNTLHSFQLNKNKEMRKCQAGAELC